MRQLSTGQKVYRFDVNRRVYEKDENGRGIGGPIWREHWTPIEVTGETSRSYVLGPEWGQYKLAKNDVHSGKLISGWALSEEEIDRHEFIEGAWSIADAVRNVRDYETLKAIAELAGWKPRRKSK